MSPAHLPIDAVQGLVRGNEPRVASRRKQRCIALGDSVVAQLTAEQVILALSVLDPSHAVALGSGSFGTTWRVELTPPDDSPRGAYAVKFVDPAIGRPWDIGREIDGLQSVSHHNVLQLHGALTLSIDGRPYVALVCDYMPGGDLAGHLATYGQPLVTEQIQLAKGLAVGLHALHSAGRFHRDLKPLNVLLRDATLAHPVIGDFGQSRGVTDDTLTQPGEQLGTFAFRAPEIVDDRSDFMQADVWSLGAVLYCVALLQVPTKTRAQVVLSAELDYLPSWYRELIESMLDFKPGFRPSMKAVVRRLAGGDSYQGGTK